MAMVQVTLKDGSVRQVAQGTSIEGLAAAIGPRLARDAVVARLEGQVVDLSTALQENCQVEILTLADSEGVEAMRHTCAHVMAQAVSRLYPSTKFAIGPVIENGFYYDFADHDFSAEDLPVIEAEMKKLIAADYPVVREEISRDEAISLFQARQDRFKLEIIADLPEDTTLTVYRQGEFVDLCRGPHLPSTGRIKVFKLMSLAGAYWRGDSNREMLTRLYAVAFAKSAQLEEHLHFLEEAKERDHRKLGKELGIFMLSKEVGQGLPLWLPNGAKVRRQIENYIVDLEESLGYHHVYTPHLASVELYKISGHWDHYHEDMFPPMVMDNEQLVLRPMNCPHHMMVYKSEMRSYRDLPLRIAELGTMYRHEMSGALAGLQRVRTMTLNDAHIFLRPDQIQEEFTRVVRLIERVYKDFGITDYYHRLSYRDPADTQKYVQNDEMWNKAEPMLRQAMNELGLEYVEAPGEAAFYGPKLDVQVRTALGKDETLSTVQLDFHLPNQFEMEYIGEDGKPHRPVVIHRGIVGTMERFVAFLLEQYKGAFPVWLAPVQVQVVTVAEEFLSYGQEVAGKLRETGFRVEVDGRPEKIGYKIRESQVRKVPFTLVVGGKERDTGGVSVRKYGQGDMGPMNIETFIKLLEEQVRTRALLVSAR
ncbi:threonine--tRNA ligase [Alicyclobacillaceae bacterium I2511]|nr:threonine--tRNA ligase [Alicyclobacillaceae bacterium I2511]